MMGRKLVQRRFMLFNTTTIKGISIESKKVFLWSSWFLRISYRKPKVHNYFDDEFSKPRWNLKQMSILLLPFKYTKTAIFMMIVFIFMKCINCLFDWKNFSTNCMIKVTVVYNKFKWVIIDLDWKIEL